MSRPYRIADAHYTLHAYRKYLAASDRPFDRELLRDLEIAHELLKRVAGYVPRELPTEDGK